MFGVVLAAFCFVISFWAHVLVSHLRPTEHKETILVTFMVAGVAAYAVTYPCFAMIGLTSNVVLPHLADSIAGFATIAFLSLGYIEFWSLVERSFSLRIIIDTAAAVNGLTSEEIAQSYSAGRGLEWMMEKRVQDLLGSGMLARYGPAYRLTTLGRLVARLFRALQALFGIH